MTRLAAERRHVVRFTLNGRSVQGEAEPRLLLSDFVRHQLGANTCCVISLLTITWRLVVGAATPRRQPRTLFVTEARSWLGP